MHSKKGLNSIYLLDNFLSLSRSILYFIYRRFSYHHIVRTNPTLRKKGMAMLYRLTPIWRLFRSYFQNCAGITKSFAVNFTERNSQDSHGLLRVHCYKLSQLFYYSYLARQILQLLWRHIKYITRFKRINASWKEYISCIFDNTIRKITFLISRYWLDFDKSRGVRYAHGRDVSTGLLKTS